MTAPRCTPHAPAAPRPWAVVAARCVALAARQQHRERVYRERQQRAVDRAAKAAAVGR